MKMRVKPLPIPCEDWEVGFPGLVHCRAGASFQAEGHRLIANGAFIVQSDGGLVCSAEPRFPGLACFLFRASGKM